jgi:hypothetical protein
VAFLINGTANPPLVLGDDYGATYSDSHVISFELYLSLLLKSKGSKEVPVDFLNKNSNDDVQDEVKLSDIEALEV